MILKRFAIGLLTLFALACATGAPDSATVETAGARAAAVVPSEPLNLDYDGRPLVNPVSGEEVTIEEWLDHWGIREDPGPDPDPARIWFRNPPGHRYQIQKFERSFAAFDQPPGLVRPIKNFNVAREIYQADDESVWVWMLAPGEVLAEQIAARSETDVSKYRNFTEEELDYFRGFRDEFTPVELKRTRKRLTFVESSEGLPEGSWRNTAAIVDMNGDGHLDIVAPPQRGGAGVPSIYLGDGRGGWSRWRATRFEADGALDYGGVAAGDLNGDGAQDFVLGVHLRGVRIFLGDGQGYFREVPSGMELDFPTRKVELVDVDLDGDLDIVALYEGPVQIRDGRAPQTPDPPAKVMVLRNDGTGRAWTPVPVTEEWRQMGGDWMEIGNFNGDAYPDIAASSIYFSGPDLFYLGGADGWTAQGRDVMPYFSYYMGLAAGRFTSRDRDDVIVTFGHFWPGEIDPERVPPPAERRVVGMYRVSWRDGEPVRVPVARWPGRFGISSIAAGDLDGDGHDDVIFAMPDPREARILLGNGAGEFALGEIEGLTLPPNASYDITLADVDRDGRLDVVMLFERDSYTPGRIRVWLNRTPAGGR